MSTAQWSASRPDPEERATTIWDRLLGCFGDSLLRKFGKTPPAEWVGAIGMLNDRQIERGLKRLVFGGKNQPPSLPEFIRVCRAVGTDDFEEGDQKLPRLAHEDTFRGDVWDMAANRFLMGHIAKRVKQNTLCYGKPASYALLQAPAKDLQELGVDPHYLDASAEMIDRIKKLIAAKNDWAADMRDLAVKGSVPVETQQAVWHDYLNRAEATNTSTP